ncbi:MAG TPA: DUF411 domain-containing protein [Longimicrobium sp.]|nr:DUF411 domain-containing protein [Longimicrobium sp.]
MSSIRTVRALLVSAAVSAFAITAACGKTGEASRPQGSAAQAPGAGSAATPAAGSAVAQAPASAQLPLAVVYKSPTCGCCNAWVTHMRQSGFRVETHDTTNVDPIKDQGHVPQNGRSCHTALVGGYVIEGHVPADLVKKLLAEKPTDVAGLTVPGMVTGSPGMEGPNPQHYDVIAFSRDGQTRVYASR